MNIIKYAQEKGADDIIVEKISGTTKQIRFANNSISIFNDWETTYYKIFLTWKKRTLNTVVLDVKEDTIKRNVDNLLASAKFLLPNENFFEIARGPFDYKKILGTFDNKMKDVDEADMISAAINAALENSKNTAGSFYTSTENRTLESSSGVTANEKSTSVQLSIRAFNSDDESGHGVSCARLLKDFNPEAAGKKAGEISKLAKNPVSGKSGKYNVIFDPLSIANLLGLVGSSSSIFYVESGLSFLKDKMGTEVASNLVNMTDDGTIPEGFNSSMFDEEGVPTQRTNIIENGVLKTYLHNTSSAKKYNTNTTGNAGLIAPAPINIILKEGSQTKEEMFKDVKIGVYITNVWYTRFQNYMTGEFSTIPRDGIFMIKNGEISGSIKNVRITENLQNMLMNISAISNRQQWIHWWGMDSGGAPILTPYVMIKDVNLTLPTM